MVKIFVLILYENLKHKIMKRKLLFGFIFSVCFLLRTVSFAQTRNQNYDGTCNEPSASGERDGNSYLGETFNMSACGLNYVQASKHITTRSNPAGSAFPCNLSISGIPQGVSVVKAFVWWVVSYKAGSSDTPLIMLTNPIWNSYIDTAYVIGTSGSKCWGELGARTFRADVTHAVAGNGIYQCNIFGNTIWEVDGVTLMIIYSDSTANWKGTLIVNDGCWTSVANPLNFSVNNIVSCPVNSSAHGFVIVSDMQVNVNPPAHSVHVETNSANFANGFWNFDTVSASYLLLQPAYANFIVFPQQNDCWCWAVAGVYLKSDSCSGCGSVGIEESELLNMEISLSPNPATNQITIQSSMFNVQSVEVFDVMGKRCIALPLYPLKGTSASIDISRLTPGIYFISITNDDGIKAVRKFVKM